MSPVRSIARFGAAPVLAAALLLAACAGALEPPSAHASGSWPPVWQDSPPPNWVDDGVPRFQPPSAAHCRRMPGVREVPGAAAMQNVGPSWAARVGRGEAAAAEGSDVTSESRLERRADAADRMAGESATKSADAARSRAASPTAPAPLAAAPSSVARESASPGWPQPMPQPSPMPRPRPAHETVTAGMVDDNADFGEYLAYRARHAGLPVRDRDIGERYLLEVTDAAGRAVHDAEVAVQRAGRAEPVAWARTDTAGRVWLHPRAFLGAAEAQERALGIAVRKGAWQGRTILARGDKAALQVRLGSAMPTQRPRLDLVFLIDATGSMGDEIAKLKHSMRAVAQQIGQLPGQPDVCYGLVAYRDRGDAFITRTHDFTDDLGAFQQVLGRVQAGGGGDTPEALNEAVHEVVHGLSWRTDAARMVVLVADAPPHLDYAGPQYDIDMQAALAKGIKLFTVGASGLDPVGQYVYRQMAQFTAGRFVFLTYKDASDPGSGPGTQTGHDVKNYSVQTLDRLIVRLVSDEMARLVRG
jgi:Mg-chelatase subunit ChlD